MTTEVATPAKHTPWVAPGFEEVTLDDGPAIERMGRHLPALLDDCLRQRFPRDRDGLEVWKRPDGPLAWRRRELWADVDALLNKVPDKPK